MMTKRPNIIFCHVDELTHTAMSGVGCADVSTPNMDRIHREGTSFARAQSTYPLCAPNRAAWFTGRPPSENGVHSNRAHVVPHLPDLGQWMTARGYDCFLAAKWHVPGRHASLGFHVLYPEYQTGERNDDDVAQTVEAFLHQHKSDKPFFLSVGFVNPHDCVYLDASATEPAFKIGVENQVELPALPPDYDPRKPLAGKFAGTWTPQVLALYRYYYYRLVEQVDAAVGRLYNAFQNRTDVESTLFIFTSDHGEMMGSRNRLKKSVLYESSLRVPLALVHPGRIAAGVRDEKHVIGGVDVTATILDYAGIDPMPDMNFARSIRALIEAAGVSPDWHRYVVAETTFGGVQQCFRAGKYKTIYNLDTNTTELFDTDADPYEQSNLCGQAAFGAVLKEHDEYRKDYLAKLKPSVSYLAELKENGSGKGNKVRQATHGEFD